MTRLLLIGLLTVLSFSAKAIDEQPIKPWVEPKVVPTDLGGCDYNYGDNLQNTSTSSCSDYLYSSFSSRSNPTNIVYNNPKSEEGSFYGNPMVTYYIYQPSTPQQSGGFYVTVGRWIKSSTSDSKICPPDGFPDYVDGPKPESPQNPTHEVCFSKFKPCPLGFFKNEVTLSNGESKCVPISCPDKGTRVNNVFNKNGAIGVGSSGTYCDGKCSYTIQPTDAPYNGSSFVFGTSNGAVCGQGQDKDIKFTPTDKEGTCTTSQLSTGANFQICTEGDGTAPEEDNAEGELDDKAQDASVDPLTKPSKYQGADCSITADQLYCVGTEIIEALDHQTAETKKQQDEKHNKLVELQKDITEYVENQQRDRATKQSSQSQTETNLILGGLSEITTAVKASSGNGGGTGGDSDSYIEQFDGDSILAKFSSDLDGMSQRIKDANDGLDNKLEEGNSKFGESDPLWNPFKDIPTYLPAEYVCQPFTLGTDEHPMILDLCEYEELIKAVIGFVFIMLTALRLFYQAQIIVRNSAIGSA